MIGFPTCRDEEGAASSVLLIAALLTALGAFVMIALPFGDAADAKAGSRTAADAAALAGAERAKEQALTNLATQGWPRLGLSALPWGWGLAGAADFANRNGATLVSYNNLVPGEVRVTVEGREVRGERARSDARAQIDSPGCQVFEVPEPEEPDEPDPGDPGAPDPPDPPDPPVYEPFPISCAGFTLTVQPIVVGGQLRYELTGDGLSLLDDAMVIRLID